MGSRHSDGERRHPKPSSSSDDPVLPNVTGDEQSAGWGDDLEEPDRDLEWYRRESPPHHEE